MNNDLKPCTLFVDGVEISFVSEECNTCADSTAMGSLDACIVNGIIKGDVMEGRGWHSVARNKGAILRPSMKRGKVYLYQLYTTCFVEFENMEAALAFRKYADENIAYWDYDPVATLDTNNPEVIERWKENMED